MTRAKTRPSNPQLKTEMNQLETAYYKEMLRPRLLAGEIQKVVFNGVSLKLSRTSRYKPDFYCLMDGGTIEFHETKGSWKAKNQRAARDKIKSAADKYPEFRFVAIQKGKRGEPRWQTEEF